jgi:predicted secreted protein
MAWSEWIVGQAEREITCELSTGQRLADDPDHADLAVAWSDGSVMVLKVVQDGKQTSGLPVVSIDSVETVDAGDKRQITALAHVLVS